MPAPALAPEQTGGYSFKMPRSTKRQLVILLTLILLTAFTAISLLNYFSSRDAMTREVVDSSLPLLRENLYSAVIRDILPSLQIASMMANDDFLVKWVKDGEINVEDVTGYLRRIRDRYSYISAFFVSASSSIYYHPAGIHKVVSTADEHDVWYYDFVESGKAYELDVDNDQASGGKLTIFVNYRLEDSSGKFLGVTGVGMEMVGFSSYLSEQQRKYNRTIYLANRDGLVQAHSDLSHIENIDIHEIAGLKDLAGGLLGNGVEPFEGRYRDDKRDVLITSRYIPDIDWFLVVEHDERAELRGLRRHLAESLLIGFLAFVLVLVLSLITISRYESRMATLAVTDALTGIANRRALEAGIPRMLYRSRRGSGQVCLVLIDLDGFKALNDRYGHNAGDQVLTEFARIAAAAIRQGDLLVRWGGDEFIIVTESTVTGAERVTEDLRKAFGESESRVSISIGIAVADDDDDIDSLTGKADAALYEAKRSDRNRTVIHAKNTSRPRNIPEQSIQ
jgi:diguanylate cyclase (GGDEF)-like protein